MILGPFLNLTHTSIPVLKSDLNTSIANPYIDPVSKPDHDHDHNPLHETLDPNLRLEIRPNLSTKTRPRYRNLSRPSSRPRPWPRFPSLNVTRPILKLNRPIIYPETRTWPLSLKSTLSLILELKLDPVPKQDPDLDIETLPRPLRGT
ncbi:hypothetical protein TIFTF001_018558 [Ficus carica]|uniref:Uncharacterized protein n=1 Tax=Ficus carica TaxID=3494 RepID=A0AA88ACP6_FICCA|nr:hypothetical protein TIFTF001_018558 [Ficus carica]